MSDYTHRPCRSCGVLVAVTGRAGRELCLFCARTGLSAEEARPVPDFNAIGYFRSQVRLFGTPVAG